MKKGSISLEIKIENLDELVLIIERLNQVIKELNNFFPEIIVDPAKEHDLNLDLNTLTPIIVEEDKENSNPIAYISERNIEVCKGYRVRFKPKD